MSKVSIIMPARNELYLQRAVDDVLTKATGDIEVIVALDNYWPSPVLKDDPRLILIHFGGRQGMRAGINAAAAIAKGDYLLKLDAHVSMQEGYDEILAADCDSDWIVTMPRYSMTVETWSPRLDKPIVQYEYLSYPWQEGRDVGLHARYWWKERDRARKDILIDENMAFQGSAWFMPKKYFMDLVYPMDEENYGMFVGEPQEIGLKVWLSGGKNMLNKKLSYSHLWKGQGYRDLHKEVVGVEYSRVGRHELIKGNKYSTDYWFHNRWPQRIRDLSWLVEKFWPVPTWPEDRNLWTRYP